MSLSFSALEVGQGDAFLLEKDGWKCLFDSGGSKSGLETLLKNKRINHLNLAVCSHNDFDHINGFLGILDTNSKITVDEIWLPGLFGSIIQYVVDNGIPREILEPEDYHIDDINLESLYDRELRAISYGEFEYNMPIGLMRIEHMLYGRYIRRWGSHYRIGLHRESLLVKLENIKEIAKKAYEAGCLIRWFEPVDGCVNNYIDYGFTALNSTETHQIKKLKGVKEFIHALTLTAENKYSLVFEYAEEGTPIVRFSADSDCTCQSVTPYPNNIIITAPHHGSEANQNVYSQIRGQDIIWVRSDRKSSKRPCAAFKSQANRYCLACRNRNFKAELRFEHDGNRWQHITGNSCTC